MANWLKLEFLSEWPLVAGAPPPANIENYLFLSILTRCNRFLVLKNVGNDTYLNRTGQKYEIQIFRFNRVT